MRDAGFVTFDYEGAYGMPRPAHYDLAAATDRILGTLAAHGARATFFVVGELAEAHPELLRTIAAGGHELAVHGYRHEPMARAGSLTADELADGLDRAGSVIAEAAGTRPCGFRAPHLLAPAFFDGGTYALLAERGYRYASNWELRHPVELARPDRLRTAAPWRALARRPRALDSWTAAVADRALNATARRRPAAPSGPARRPPFSRGGLLEVPLYAPMDCDLFGLPDPETAIAPPLHAYAAFALGHCARGTTLPPLLTFHDWLIAGEGRIDLLDSALAAMRAAGRTPVAIAERLDALDALDGFGG